MVSYPVEIRRCQHIKTSGAQCGSPAMKEKECCYYHQENRKEAAHLYIDGERYADGSIMIPPFEDAHAIQMVLRQVVQLMMDRRIERKDAGLMLYALQIASGNLKQMRAEKPRPTQMVLEPEKVGETPMGMTPWSASGEGHDPEPEPGDDGHEDERSYEELKEELEEAREESKQAADYAERVVGNCRLTARASAMWLRRWIEEEGTLESLKKNLVDMAESRESQASAEWWSEWRLDPLEMVREKLAVA